MICAKPEICHGHWTHSKATCWVGGRGVDGFVGHPKSRWWRPLWISWARSRPRVKLRAEASWSHVISPKIASLNPDSALKTESRMFHPSIPALCEIAKKSVVQDCSSSKLSMPLTNALSSTIMHSSIGLKSNIKRCKIKMTAWRKNCELYRRCGIRSFVKQIVQCLTLQSLTVCSSDSCSSSITTRSTYLQISSRPECNWGVTWFLPLSQL